MNRNLYVPMDNLADANAMASFYFDKFQEVLVILNKKSDEFFIELDKQVPQVPKP